jgi:hypothetical protein
MKPTDFIKGQRVYLADLVEEYPGEPKQYYAAYHRDMLMTGPFTVIAAGRRRTTFCTLDGKRGEMFNGDSGLTPYGSKWNETNATFEMLPKPQWADDWM